jgi:hypothetical protein
MQDLESAHFVVLVTGGGPACTGQPCSTGCVDLDATLAAVRALVAQRIQVLVVAVGAEVATGENAQVLEALARAGSEVFSRCDATFPCANGTACTAGRCARSFLLPSEVETLLGPFPANVDSSVCDFALRTRPERPEYVSVLLNGALAAPGPDTWSWLPDLGAVRLEGEACRTARKSTFRAPFEITVRVLEVL